MYARPETAWEFKTARFRVCLEIRQDLDYRYDGDDENGETQAGLDAGDFVAFDSLVRVFLDGVEVSSDSLGGSVYGVNDVAEFWTAHRGADPLDRNCSIMRAARGSNVCICHYFPEMVRQAIAAARATICNAPRLRCAALICPSSRPTQQINQQGKPDHGLSSNHHEILRPDQFARFARQGFCAGRICHGELGPRA